MSPYVLISFFIVLWFFIFSWHLNKRKQDQQDDFNARIQKPDIDQIAEILEKTKEYKPEGFFEKKAYQLEQSGTGWTLQKYILFSILFMMGGFVVGNWFFQNILFGIIVSFVSLTLPNALVNRKRRKNLDQFNLYYRNTLLRMSSNLRAGGTIKQAVLDVATGSDAHESVQNEFRRAHTDLEYGHTIEESFLRMFRRTGSEDVKMTSIVVAIQRRKGGNLAELLDSIQKTITDRANAKRKVLTLTAQQRSQANMLTGLPFFMYGFFMLYNPSYYRDFLATLVGQIITFGCVAMIILGNVIMKKLTK